MKQVRNQLHCIVVDFQGRLMDLRMCTTIARKSWRWIWRASALNRDPGGKARG